MADRAIALSLFALSLHNISLQRKCGKIVQNLCLDQTSLPQVAVAQSVIAIALQFGVGHVIIIALQLQGGIFFVNLQGMAYLTQSNIS